MLKPNNSDRKLPVQYQTHTIAGRVAQYFSKLVSTVAGSINQIIKTKEKRHLKRTHWDVGIEVTEFVSLPLLVYLNILIIIIIFIIIKLFHHRLLKSFKTT